MTHILFLATFIQTVHTASISWAKGYCGAVIHKSVQLVNSIKLPSTPRVALETSVNLLTTTVKCLHMVNIAHQSLYSKASVNLRSTDLSQRHDITQQPQLPKHLWILLFCRGCKEKPLGLQLMCKHQTHTHTHTHIYTLFSCRSKGAVPQGWRHSCRWGWSESKYEHKTCTPSFDGIHTEEAFLLRSPLP